MEGGLAIVAESSRRVARSPGCRVAGLPGRQVAGSPGLQFAATGQPGDPRSCNLS